jgi:hypothetical protein
VPWLVGPLGFFGALGVALVLVALRWRDVEARARLVSQVLIGQYEKALHENHMERLTLTTRQGARIESDERQAWVVDGTRPGELVLIWTDGVPSDEPLELRSAIHFDQTENLELYLSSEGAEVPTRELPLEAVSQKFRIDESLVRFDGSWDTVEADLRAGRGVAPLDAGR